MKLVRVCMVVLLNLLKLFGAIFFFFGTLIWNLLALSMTQSILNSKINSL